MEHIAVIGGTGLLRGMCIHFANEGKAVSVIARNKERIVEIVAETQKSPGLIIPIAVDYTDTDTFRDKLDEAAAHLGPPKLTIARIAPESMPTRKAVAQFLHDNAAGTRLFDLICIDKAKGENFPAKDFDFEYRKIILGRGIEGGEITAGILEAIIADDPEYMLESR